MLARSKTVGKSVCRRKCSVQPSRRASVALAATMGPPNPTRSLHYVFKIGDRKAVHDFLGRVLQMKVLRHEEFEEGCAAACNGPYDNRWSKTMCGYADEDSSFVLELTYNYNVKSYQLGNDFHHISISNKGVYSSVQTSGLGTPQGNKRLEVLAPDGHKFWIVDEDVAGPNPVTEVALNVEDLQKSLAYWSGFLKFSVEEQTTESAVVRPGPGQTALRLVQLGTKIEHGTGYGRIAYSCPGEQLPALEADVRAAGYKVHTPYVSLDTPGKATVQVIILQDPDGHEVCFVGDAGFRQLSQVDPKAAQLLAEQIEQDKSAEWAQKMQARLAAMAAKGV